jgi:hypothetical protein
VDATTRNGDSGDVTGIVERLTGIPPRSFHDYLVENRDGLLAAARTPK